MSGKNKHVVPVGVDWGVRKEGNKRLTVVTPAKAGAEKAARDPKMYRSEEFDFENAHYEITAVRGKHGYEVRVAKDDNPLPWKYSVDFQDVDDFQIYVREDAIVALVKLAKDNILEGRFDALLASISK